MIGRLGMATTSSDICAAADRLQGFVGYNLKTARHLVRFSEDAFGLDVESSSIVPLCEFVWEEISPTMQALRRERLQLLFDQRIDERLAISEPLRLYLRRSDLPEIVAERHLKNMRMA